MATLIVLVMVLLAIAAMALGATVGVPGAIKEPPRPKPKPALATAGVGVGVLLPEQMQQEAFFREQQRAAALRLQMPSVEPDDSPGMQMKVMTGILVSGLIILALGAYALWEPTREADAAQIQLHENVLRGAALFTTYCARCHGPTGTGLIGPNLHLQEFAARYKWNTSDPSDMAKMRTLVIQTITNGRPPTPMPAWGQENGGPFNETQISNLADLIMTNGWQYVVPAPGAATAAAPTPAPNAPPGQALMQKYGCGGCHTIDGVAGMTGTVGPNLTHVGSVPKIPESTGNLTNTPDNLAKWIFDAPAVKPGVIMPNFSQQGMSQDDAKQIAQYLETLK
ncbi:MAG TPA: c-type cytochrome [Chloroflexota bacterium]|jgi:cytochrome c|nr:c-type cytochrome [Chloroflexota bacterium]